MKKKAVFETSKILNEARLNGFDEMHHALVDAIGVSRALQELDPERNNYHDRSDIGDAERPKELTWDQYRDRTKKAMDVYTTPDKFAKDKNGKERTFLYWIKKDDSPASNFFVKVFEKILRYFNYESEETVKARDENTLRKRGHDKFWKPVGHDVKKVMKKVKSDLGMKPPKHKK